MRIVYGVVLVLFGSLALASPPAQASVSDPETPLAVRTVDPPGPEFDPRTSLTARMQLPLVGIAPRGFTLMSESLAVRFAGLVETEVGTSRTLSCCDDGESWFVRAGISPSVLTAKAQGTHWNLRIPVLVSFVDYSGRGGGDDPGHDYYGYQISTGLDATYWGQGHGGFNVRLLGGTGGGYERETGGYTHDHSWTSIPFGRAWPEISLSIGLALK